MVLTRGRVALLATFLLVVGIVPARPAIAAHDGDLADACPARTPEDGFSDIPESNVHEDAVDCVAWWGVASGQTARSYAPSDTVRRDQMASFLARSMEAAGHRLPADAPDRFRDDDSSVHEERINQLAAAGVVSGTSAGRYDPSAPVSRAQMASFLVRTVEAVIDDRLPRGGDRFPDDDSSPHEPAIDAAAAAGIAQGSGGRYHPDDHVRRDAMGSFLARTLDTLVEHGHGQSPRPPVVPGPDPLEDRQWGLVRVHARDALLSATGAETIIAIVDSGVDREHPELGARLTRGASWIDCDGSPPCDNWDDSYGHGTHVAGIAAAPLDGQGVAGVAPHARLMPIRVLDENGNGTAADVADGIHYAVEHGADVINLSLGGLPVASQLEAELGADGGYADAVKEAVDAGVLVVAAAGNNGAPFCGSESFRQNRALCVGATERNNAKASYSSFGSGLDVVAPGGDIATCEGGILSTYATDESSNCGYAVGYSVQSGTSMAAPHVAGVGALLVELGIRGPAAAQRIIATATDLGQSGRDNVYGHGLVNARDAVRS